MTSTQRLGNGRGDVASIPLSPDKQPAPSEQSIGDLVKDATTHMSALIRSEFELAKTELAAEVRKGLVGGMWFGLAFVVLSYLVLFTFVLIGEALTNWFSRPVAYGIVWVAGLVTLLLFVLLGVLQLRRIRKPTRTIDSMRDTAAAIRREVAGDDAEEHGEARRGQPV